MIKNVQDIKRKRHGRHHKYGVYEVKGGHDLYNAVCTGCGKRHIIQSGKKLISMYHGLEIEIKPCFKCARKRSFLRDAKAIF